MQFFLNELSLHGQFNTLHEFLSALQEIFSCRDEITKVGYRLYCSRSILTRPTLNNDAFQQTVMKSGNPNLKRNVMIWLSKHGPFWDESREHTSDDYFEVDDQIMTDSSLAEAAFRLAHKQKADSVSFHPSNFLKTPLIVTWHRTDDKILIEVPNFWDATTLENHLKQERPPLRSWADLLNRAATDFAHLTFLDSVRDSLEGEPFNSTIAERVMELLRILNTLQTSFDEQGNRTAEGHQIMDLYFRRQTAIFSDESDSNKIKFRKQLTFKKPEGAEIFCPLHGKIRHRTFRLHFSWPIKHNTPLYIAYIGPKITKD